jgi:preprotein translocase subunit YajC
VASLSKGDKIISIGGMHGTVHHISKTTVTVKLSENVFVPFEKDAIRSVTKVGNSSNKDSSEEQENSEEES